MRKYAKNADQYGHLISAFVFNSLAKSEISSFLPSPVAVQANLPVYWSETPNTCFVVTRLISRRPVSLKQGYVGIDTSMRLYKLEVLYIQSKV